MELYQMIKTKEMATRAILIKIAPVIVTMMQIILQYFTLLLYVLKMQYVPEAPLLLVNAEKDTKLKEIRVFLVE